MIALLLVVPIVLFSRGSGGLTSAQLHAYESAISGPLKSGGELIQLGMKPAIDDLVNKHLVPPERMIGEASGWAQRFTAIRRQIAQVEAPKALVAAADDLDEALAKYARAALLFQRAVQATPQQRPALLKEVYAAGEAGDRLYDAGGLVLQRWHHRFGEPRSPLFRDLPEQEQTPH